MRFAKRSLVAGTKLWPQPFLFLQPRPDCFQEAALEPDPRPRTPGRIQYGACPIDPERTLQSAALAGPQAEMFTSVPVSSPVVWARAAPAEAVALALVWATASWVRSTIGAGAGASPVEAGGV